MVRKINLTESEKYGDQRAKNISSISNMISERVKNSAKVDKYMDEKISSKSSLNSIDTTLKNLSLATGGLIAGMKMMTTEASQGIKAIVSAGAGAINEYASALSEDFSINRQALVVQTIGKISPLVGYAVAKFMDTTIFRNLIEKTKNTISSVFKGFKNILSGGWDFMRGLIPFAGKKNKKKKKSFDEYGYEIPHMQHGGFVKRGGLAEVHTAEVVSPVDKFIHTITSSIFERIPFFSSNPKQRRFFFKEIGTAIKETWDEEKGKKSLMFHISENIRRISEVFAKVRTVVDFFGSVWRNFFMRLRGYQKVLLLGLGGFGKLIMSPFKAIFRRRGGPLKPTGNLVRDAIASSFSQQGFISENLPIISKNTNDIANILTLVLSAITGEKLIRKNIEAGKSYTWIGKFAGGTFGLVKRMFGFKKKEKKEEGLTIEELMGIGPKKKLSLKERLKEKYLSSVESAKRIKDAAFRKVGSLKNLIYEKTPEFLAGAREKTSSLFDKLVAAKDKINSLGANKLSIGSPQYSKYISTKLFDKLNTIIMILRKQRLDFIEQNRYTKKRNLKNDQDKSFFDKLILPMVLMTMPVITAAGGAIMAFLANPATLAGILAASIGTAVGAVISKDVNTLINKWYKRDEEKAKKIEKKSSIGLTKDLRILQSNVGSVEEKAMIANKRRIISDARLKTSIGMAGSGLKRFAGEAFHTQFEAGRNSYIERNFGAYSAYSPTDIAEFRSKWIAPMPPVLGVGVDAITLGSKTEAKFFSEFKENYKKKHKPMKTRQELLKEGGVEEFRIRQLNAPYEFSEATKKHIAQAMSVFSSATKFLAGGVTWPFNQLLMMTDEKLLSDPEGTIKLCQEAVTKGRSLSEAVRNSAGYAKALSFAEKVIENKSVFQDLANQKNKYDATLVKMTNILKEKYKSGSKSLDEYKLEAAAIIEANRGLIGMTGEGLKTNTVSMYEDLKRFAEEKRPVAQEVVEGATTTIIEILLKFIEYEKKVRDDAVKSYEEVKESNKNKKPVVVNNNYNVNSSQSANNSVMGGGNSGVGAERYNSAEVVQLTGGITR